jgi:hypothetical protein
MAGKKQHYVPRFLQMGFRCRLEFEGDASLAWLYLKGREPAMASVKDIGHSDWFYTFRRNGETIECADGAITAAEGTWMSDVVRGLREDADFDLEVHHAEIAQLLSHLVIRNRATWKLIEAPAAPLFARLQDAAQDPIWLREALKQLLETNRPFFEAALSTVFPSVDIRVLVEEVETALAKGTGPQVSDGAVPVLNYLHEELMPPMLKVFRVRTLMEALRDPTQLKLFKGCAFELMHNPEGALIQGDTPVLFHRAHDSGFTPVPSEGEEFDYAYLPLSPSIALVATKGGRPQSWSALRQASAACSHTYFIAAEKRPDFSALTDSIATSFPQPSLRQLDGMFADALKEAGTFDAEDSELLGVLSAVFSHALKSAEPKPKDA